jgi:hypothetical protein
MLPPDGLLMIAIPLLIGAYITAVQAGLGAVLDRRITFILSQVGHILSTQFWIIRKGRCPCPGGMAGGFLRLAGGLRLGSECAVCDLPLVGENANFWQGYPAWAGHGGMGRSSARIVLYTFTTCWLWGATGDLVPTEQLALAQGGERLLVTPLNVAAEAVERCSPSFHIACSVIVLQVFLRRQSAGCAGDLLHTLVDALIPGITWTMLQPYEWGVCRGRLLGLTVL